jgi:hypothetical protein
MCFNRLHYRVFLSDVFLRCSLWAHSTIGAATQAKNCCCQMLTGGNFPIACPNGLRGLMCSGKPTTPQPYLFPGATPQTLRSCVLSWSQSAAAGAAHVSFFCTSFCFILTRVACSDKPIALGADESKDKAKELLDWSSQLDRIDELVHTREELRAYSPPRSRFNQTDFKSRSYIPPLMLSITRIHSATLKGTYSPRRACLAFHCGLAAAMRIGFKKMTWLTPISSLWRCR